MADLMELYRLLKEHHLLYLINVQDIQHEEKTLTLKLVPVGTVEPHISPLTDAELRQIAHDILQALHWLHSYGFVHRDVRAPNIILDAGSFYRLIDMEHVGREGPPGFPAFLHWRTSASQMYTKSDDLHGLSEIISMFAHISEEARLFAEQLAIAETAESALEDEYLRGAEHA